MNIELKRISIYDRMSEETTAFNADLWVNGKKIGEASNEGHGGPTSYGAINNDEARKLLAQAEAYCKTLPPVTSEVVFAGEEPFTYDQTLETFIDDLIEKECERKEKAKLEKKMAKEMDKGIVYGKYNKSGVVYGVITLKAKISIPDLLKHPKGPEAIRNMIAAAKAKLGEGESILNTNLPKEYEVN